MMSTTALRRFVNRSTLAAGVAVAAAVITACAAPAQPATGGGTTPAPSTAPSPSVVATTETPTPSAGGPTTDSGTPEPSPTGSATPPVGAVQLEDTVWVLTGATGPDGTPVVPADAKVPESTLQITDGRLLVKICNTGSGAVQVDDDTLTVGPMAMTLMACADPVVSELETLAIQLFQEPVSYAVSGDALTIQNSAGTLTYQAQPATDTPPADLDGTVWTLTNATDPSGGSVPGAAESGATLAIEGDRAVVQTGCNNGSGGVTVDGQTLTFGPIAITRMACLDEDANRVEQVFTSVLDGEATFHLEDGLLTITNAAGTLVFESSSGPVSPAEPVPPAVPVPSELTTGMTAVTRDSGGMLPSIPEDPTTRTE